jgi:hypothetical protein
MTAPLDLMATRRAHHRARILEVLATGAVSVGTLDSLGRAFRREPRELRTCLLELAWAGLIAVGQEGARLTLRPERRPGEDRPGPGAGTWAR